MIIGIVQVRMASTRLPKKAMVDLCGRPLLWHVIDRARKSKFIDKIVIATTESPEDDVIGKFCSDIKVDIFRGNADDVLDRFYQCAKKYLADIIVRITADDPFKEPAIIDRAIKLLISDKSLDYVSNTVKPSYPEGLDVEAFTFKTLEEAWSESRLPSEREHVTPYIWKNPLQFSILNFENKIDLSSMRWTLDNEADLRFTKEVYARLYVPGSIFKLDAILALLEKEPWISAINGGIERNTGYKKSVIQENKK